jgi:hypothetical protein
MHANGVEAVRMRKKKKKPSKLAGPYASLSDT